MTLTELRYVVAIARHRHFAHAAEACFVSQPTLSVAVRKLEEELNVRLFERSRSEVLITPIGEAIVRQAELVLREAAQITDIADAAQDPLGSTLRLGVIYTIGPYLVPHLIPALKTIAPKLNLVVRENFTDQLAEELVHGQLDIAIMSLPFSHPRLVSRPLYDEPFHVALPASHPLAKRKRIPAERLDDERLLLLGARNCFRDQVIEICPSCIDTRDRKPDDIQSMLENSSLETICQMVAAGAGVTVLPATTRLTEPLGNQLAIRRFAKPEPFRSVAAFYRRGFARPQLVQTLAEAIRQTKLAEIQMMK